MLAGCRPEVVLDGMGTRKRAPSSMARTKRMQVTMPAPGPGDRYMLHEPQLPTLPRAAGTTLRLDSAPAPSDRLRLPSWRSCAQLEFSRLRHERGLAGATLATSLTGRQGQASGRKPIIAWRGADSREGCQEIGPVQYAAGTSKCGAGQRIFGLKAAPLRLTAFKKCVLHEKDGAAGLSFEVIGTTNLVGLSRIVGRRNQITAEFLAYLAELDERQLFLDLGFSSLFEYCVEAFNLCERRQVVTSRRRGSAAIRRLICRAELPSASHPSHLWAPRIRKKADKKVRDTRDVEVRRSAAGGSEAVAEGMFE